jgi:hypothetical protein
MNHLPPKGGTKRITPPWKTTKVRRKGKDRPIPTPACLQKVAHVVEEKDETLCPFSMIQTDFGEGLEFDYAKATNLVIIASGLEASGC